MGGAVARLMRQFAVFAGALLLAALAHAQPGPGHSAEAGVSAVTAKFLEAKQMYDVAALQALTDDTYVEITEDGVKRTRAAMLAFHALGRRGVYRIMQIDEVETRLQDEVAVQTMLLNYKVIAAHKDLLSAARATLVAQRRDGQWKVVSAHFTAVTPAPVTRPQPSGSAGSFGSRP
jgi:hypothetical protein